LKTPQRWSHVLSFFEHDRIDLLKPALMISWHVSRIKHPPLEPHVQIIIRFFTCILHCFCLSCAKGRFATNYQHKKW
jgi:hypothetical protein